MALVCPECKGLKYIIKTDVMKATKKQETCPKCKGAGKVSEESDKPIHTGIRIVEPQWKLVMLQYVEKNQEIATLQIWLSPLKDKCGNPVMNGDKPVMLAQIPNMFVEKRYRRLKVMSGLISCLKDMPLIGAISTKYTHSSYAGIQTLVKNGFQHIGNDLVWTNDKLLPEELGDGRL